MPIHVYHLEMLGVELRPTWTETRKANGDIVKSRKHYQGMEVWKVYGSKSTWVVSESVLYVQGLLQDPQCGPEGDGYIQDY